MKVEIRYADGREPLEIVVGPRAQVAVERKFDILFTEAFDREGRLEYIYYCAWAAAFYAGLESEEDFDKWLLGIEDVAPCPEGKANPTRRARPPAKSSS